jgi:hypothetical protein
MWRSLNSLGSYLSHFAKEVFESTTEAFALPFKKSRDFVDAYPLNYLRFEPNRLELEIEKAWKVIQPFLNSLDKDERNTANLQALNLLTTINDINPKYFLAKTTELVQKNIANGAWLPHIVKSCAKSCANTENWLPSKEDCKLAVDAALQLLEEGKINDFINLSRSPYTFRTDNFKAKFKESLVRLSNNINQGTEDFDISFSTSLKIPYQQEVDVTKLVEEAFNEIKWFQDKTKFIPALTDQGIMDIFFQKGIELGYGEPSLFIVVPNYNSALGRLAAHLFRDLGGATLTLDNKHSKEPWNYYYDQHQVCFSLAPNSVIPLNTKKAILAFENAEALLKLRSEEDKHIFTDPNVSNEPSFRSLLLIDESDYQVENSNTLYNLFNKVPSFIVKSKVINNSYGLSSPEFDDYFGLLKQVATIQINMHKRVIINYFSDSEAVKNPEFTKKLANQFKRFELI